MSDNDKSRKAANEQLMPCPFCGGKARVFEHVLPVTRFLDFGRRRIMTEFVYGITCRECGAMSNQHYETMGEAVNAWNTRTEEIKDDNDSVRRGEVLNHLGDLFTLCSETGETLLRRSRREVRNEYEGAS